jgi:hypothetical protein
MARGWGYGDPQCVVSGSGRRLSCLVNAAALYPKFLTIFEVLGDRPRMATSSHQLGIVAQRWGRLKDARADDHRARYASSLPVGFFRLFCDRYLAGSRGRCIDSHTGHGGACLFGSPTSNADVKAHRTRLERRRETGKEGRH